jgi:hypothetical protein
MNLKTIFVSALFLFGAAAWGQMPAKPGPEVKKLDYFLGNWTVEATIGQGP